MYKYAYTYSPHLHEKLNAEILILKDNFFKHNKIEVIKNTFKTANKYSTYYTA